MKIVKEVFIYCLVTFCILIYLVISLSVCIFDWLYNLVDKNYRKFFDSLKFDNHD